MERNIWERSKEVVRQTESVGLNLIRPLKEKITSGFTRLIDNISSVVLNVDFLEVEKKVVAVSLGAIAAGSCFLVGKGFLDLTLMHDPLAPAEMLFGTVVFCADILAITAYDKIFNPTL